jgi:hypothetical protein
VYFRDGFIASSQADAVDQVPGKPALVAKNRSSRHQVARVEPDINHFERGTACLSRLT